MLPIAELRVALGSVIQLRRQQQRQQLLSLFCGVLLL